MKETNQDTIYDVIIIGGGIIGAAVYHTLYERYPQKKVLLIEKEHTVALHQTGRNSGVIHSGIYYKPGSLKAKNCKRGRTLLLEFAKKNQISYELCGKIIVATDQSEAQRLENIYKRGIQNKTEDIESIDAHQIKEIEPFCEGIKAIRVGSAGIIDYKGMNQKLIQIPDSTNSFQSIFNAKVLDFKPQDTHTLVVTKTKNYLGKMIINAAGLFADRIAKKDVKSSFSEKIVPFRGDYYELTKEATHKVKHLIYPVADPNFPFLGVHFTRMIDGRVECGPNAVFSFKREGYSRASFSLKDTIESLSYPGTLKLFAAHWKMGLEEYKRAFSKRLFLRSLQKLMPSLTMKDIKPTRSGVRAQALTKDGSLVDDFLMIEHDKAIHLINAPSPAATACLAIAESIVDAYSKRIHS